MSIDILLVVFIHTFTGIHRHISYYKTKMELVHEVEQSIPMKFVPDSSSSLNIEKLQLQLTQLVSDGFNVNAAFSILSPVDKLLSNDQFAQNIKTITLSLAQDRNGDDRFTMDDLVLLSKDKAAIIVLVKSLVLSVAAIPNMKVKYEFGTSEELIFKLIIYIMLVAIPSNTSIHFTEKQQTSIINVSIQIYQFILATRITDDIFRKIIGFFQRKKLCLCCVVENDSETIVQNQLPPLTAELQLNIENKQLLQAMIASPRVDITSPPK